MDVIPAADADNDVTTQLVTAVTGTPATTSPSHLPEPELQELLPAAAQPAVAGDANHDTCAICNQLDPPPYKCCRVVNVQWVGCYLVTILNLAKLWFYLNYYMSFKPVVYVK